MRAYTIIVVLICFIATSCSKSKLSVEDREVVAFHSISVSNGVSVVLEQGQSNTLKIEAHKKVLPKIKTEVKDSVLYISFENDVNISTPKSVYVQVENLKSIKSERGSAISSKGKLTFKDLIITSKEGSSVRLDADFSATNVLCESLSGSSIRLKINGKIDFVSVLSESGSRLDMENIIASKVDVKSSEGSGIILNGKANFASAIAKSGSSVRMGDFVVSNADVKATSGSSVRIKANQMNILEKDISSRIENEVEDIKE